MVHKYTSSSYRSVDCIGLDLTWFSSVSSERLCVFGLCGAMYIYIYIKKFLLTSFSLPFSELNLLGLALDLVDYHHSSVLWRCRLGQLTRKIVPKMTYTVSSGTLNPTIPYPGIWAYQRCTVLADRRPHFMFFDLSRSCEWVTKQLNSQTV